MSTLINKYDAIENLIYKEGLKITSIKVSPTNDKLFIHLNNDLTFITPTKNYKGLKNATAKRLKNYRLIGSGIGIHWPDLNEDLSLKGFLQEFLRQKIRSRRKFVIA